MYYLILKFDVLLILTERREILLKLQAFGTSSIRLDVMHLQSDALTDSLKFEKKIPYTKAVLRMCKNVTFHIRLKIVAVYFKMATENVHGFHFYKETLFYKQIG